MSGTGNGGCASLEEFERPQALCRFEKFVRGTPRNRRGFHLSVADHALAVDDELGAADGSKHEEGVASKELRDAVFGVAQQRKGKTVFGGEALVFGCGVTADADDLQIEILE